MVDVNKSTDNYTTSGKVLSNYGVVKGVWVALTDAADLSITVYDTTLASGTLTGETKLTPGTVVQGSVNKHYYLDLHNQYYSNGIYVDVSTTSGTYTYRVLYDS